MPRSHHVSVYTGPDRQQRESYGRVWPTGLRGQSHRDTSYLGYRDTDYADEARPRNEAAWNRYRNQSENQRSGYLRSMRNNTQTAQSDESRYMARRRTEQRRCGTPRSVMPSHRDYDELSPDHDLIRFMNFRESERCGHAVPGTRTLDFSYRPGNAGNYRISNRDAENREPGHFYSRPGSDWREVNHNGTWGWR